MSKFPISSFGKQPTSRCRSAGGISLQPKIGYHGGMSRPGTPLTPSDLVNAKATPSPGEYGDPRGMVELIKLHKSGKFGLEDLPSVFDVHVALTAGFPGPSHYEETILPMHKGDGKIDIEDLQTVRGNLASSLRILLTLCVPAFRRQLRISFLGSTLRY